MTRNWLSLFGERLARDVEELMNQAILILLCLGLSSGAGGRAAAQSLTASDASQSALKNSERDSATKRIAAAAVEIDASGAADSDGFVALNRAIGDARIVMLGEPWHGDGGAIRFRAQLVKYLHEQMNFDVLAFEADFYSLHEGWKQAKANGKVEQMAAENVYSFWSQTRSAASLWQYVGEQLRGNKPLIVAGVDTKMVGRLSREQLPGELRKRLLQLPNVSPGDADRAAKTFDALVNPAQSAPSVTKEEFALLLRLVGELERYLAQQPQEVFWAQLAQSIRRNLAGENRDPGMAANLIWLATRLYPDKKIIVWAHNNHIVTDKWMFYESPDPFVKGLVAKQTAGSIGRATYLGDATREFFGSRVYSIATVPYAGSYSPDIVPALSGKSGDFNKTAALTPAPPESLEAAFKQAGRKTAFVNLRPFRGSTDSVISRVLDYTQLNPLSLRVWEGYDGLLFLEKTHALNELPDVKAFR